jgi:hypothetical protein
MPQLSFFRSIIWDDKFAKFLSETHPKNEASECLHLRHATA